MQGDETISTLAHVIQLAVAPVFLLTGIGALLGVLTNRLGRVIDRGRSLEADAIRAGAAVDERVFQESTVLGQRGRMINRAISLCTLSALLVCVVIVALFVGAFLKADLSVAIGLLFIAAMLSLVGGLIYFLREIHLAMVITPVSELQSRNVDESDR